MNISNVIQISSFGYHSLILDREGNVFSFGNNEVKFFFKNSWED